MVLRTLLPVLSLLLSTSCQQSPRQHAHLVIGTCWEPSSIQVLRRELAQASGSMGSVTIDIRTFRPTALQEYLLRNQPRSGRDALDIAIVPSNWLGQLVQQDIISEIPAARAEQLRNTVVQQALLVVSDGPRPFAFPISAEVHALVYNPRMFPRAPASLDEIIHTSLPTGVIPFACNIGDPFHIAPFVSSLQGFIIGDTGGYLWQQQAVVEVFKRLSPTWQNRDLWPLVRGANIDSLHLQLFAEGRLASFISPPWLLPALEGLGKEYQVVPIPAFAKAPSPAKAIVGYQCVVISRESEWSDLAMEVASRLLDEDTNNRLNQGARRLSPLLANYEKQPGDMPGGTIGFLRALEEGQAYPATPNWQSEFQRVSNQLVLVSSTSAPPTMERIQEIFSGGRE